MGRIGDSLDNAVAESFFATLKRELGGPWASLEQARPAVFSWIAFYNHRRRQSAIATTAPSTTRGSPHTNSRPLHEPQVSTPREDPATSPWSAQLGGLIPAGHPWPC